MMNNNLVFFMSNQMSHFVTTRKTIKPSISTFSFNIYQLHTTFWFIFTLSTVLVCDSMNQFCTLKPNNFMKHE